MTIRHRMLEPESQVSHATLNPDHLLPRFMDALKWLDPVHYHIRHLELQELQREARTSEDPNPALHALSEFLWETLMDDFQKYCPEGYFFGSHPGDGSDFGCWSESLLDNFQENHINLSK